MKRAFTFLILLLAIVANGAVYTSTNATWASVNWVETNKIQSGDFLHIPRADANGAYWPQRINILVPQTIYGDGSNSATGTCITNMQAFTTDTPGDNPLFTVQPNVDGFVTISNLFLQDSNQTSIGINSGYGNAVCPTRVRICYVTFSGFRFAVWFTELFGVVDHCIFLDNRIIRSTQFGNAGGSWLGQFVGSMGPPWPMNTTNAIFFEDDIIVEDANLQIPYIAFDTEIPSTYIVRHSLYNENMPGTYLDNNDMHGDSVNSGYSNPTNAVGLKIYDNIFNFVSIANGGSRIANIRGGVGAMVYSNTVLQNGTVDLAIQTNPSNGDPPTNAYIFANYDVNTLIPVEQLDGMTTLGKNFFTNAPSGGFSAYEAPYPHWLVALSQNSSVNTNGMLALNAGNGKFTIGSGNGTMTLNH
jgi:hypothetical protein